MNGYTSWRHSQSYFTCICTIYFNIYLICAPPLYQSWNLIYTYLYFHKSAYQTIIFLTCSTEFLLFLWSCISINFWVWLIKIFNPALISYTIWSHCQSSIMYFAPYLYNFIHFNQYYFTHVHFNSILKMPRKFSARSGPCLLKKRSILNVNHYYYYYYYYYIMSSV